MAETPENNIEQRLRDYAKQRREQTGTPAMHPATRQMLQAEVKRRHGATTATETPSSRGLLLRFWPRIAFACGFAALLGAAVWMTRSPEKPGASHFTLAKSDDAAEPGSDERRNAVAPGAPAPATVPVDGETAEFFAPRESSAATLPVESASDAAPPPRAQPMLHFDAADRARIDSASGTPALLSLKTGRKEGVADTASNASARLGGVEHQEIAGKLSTHAAAAPSREVAKSAPAPASFGMAATSEIKNRSLGDLGMDRARADELSLTQRFRNAALVPQAKDATQLPLHDEFTFKQSGEALTVVDRDGSVYNGFVRPAPLPEDDSGVTHDGKQAESLATTAGAVAGGSLPDTRRPTQLGGRLNEREAADQRHAVAPADGEPQNWYFRVEGTNRSLNQRVVFTGNVLQNPANETYANAIQAAPAEPVAVQQLRFQNYVSNLNSAVQIQGRNNFLNGRVILGNSRSGTELNAISVER